MSVLAADVSQYQGGVNWNAMPPIALIKMSGGDNGLYMDRAAATNYLGAVKAKKAVGGYHFIGWKVGAVAEANYFIQAMSPVAEYDVFALDIEAIPAGFNPVPYVQNMVNTIHTKLNLYPLVYMSLATLRAYNWTNVLKNCGLWLADWNNEPEGTIPDVPVYVMQQYNDGPNYDHDEWFGTVEEFKAYGYKTPTKQSSAPMVAPALSQTQTVAETVATAPLVDAPVVPTTPTLTNQEINVAPEGSTSASSEASMLDDIDSTELGIPDEAIDNPNILPAKQESSIVSFLAGKKTYIVSLVTVASGLAQALQSHQISVTTIEAILGGAAMAALRAAIAKLEAKL